MINSFDNNVETTVAMEDLANIVKAEVRRKYGCNEAARAIHTLEHRLA